MATIDELRARAELIAEEQQIGGNTAERVGDAFDMVADIIEAVAPGDQQAVLYNPQSPNEAQKAQARANIGAQETISDIEDFVKVSAQTFTAAQKQQARENIGAEQEGGAVKNLAGSASDTETLIKAANNPNLQANVHLSGNNIYVNGIAGGIELDGNGVNLKAGNSGYPNAKVKVNGQEVATKIYVDGKVDDRADPIELALAAIEAVIPSQATAQNQLADKNFVNSSISSSTANFVGTFDSLAELQAVQNPTNNDYGFVIETDAVGNEYYDRYKYNGTAWLFEYKVESTPFTAEEWAAIQSGITAALVGKLSALPTNAELTTSLNAKADKSDTYTKQEVDDAIEAIDVSEQINGKADKVTGAVTGDFAGLDANGNLTDSGKKASDFATAAQGAKADAAAPQATTYNKTEVDGKLAGKQATISDLETIRTGAAAGATAVQPAAMNTALEGKADVSVVAANTEDIAELQEAYAALTQSDVVVGALPAAGIVNTIYRVPGTSSYSDYMWDGTQFVLMATYDNAIDDVPTEGSANLVKSGGVYAELYGGETYELPSGLTELNWQTSTTRKIYYADGALTFYSNTVQGCNIGQTASDGWTNNANWKIVDSAFWDGDEPLVAKVRYNLAQDTELRIYVKRGESGSLGYPIGRPTITSGEGVLMIDVKTLLMEYYSTGYRDITHITFGGMYATSTSGPYGESQIDVYGFERSVKGVRAEVEGAVARVDALEPRVEDCEDRITDLEQTRGEGSYPYTYAYGSALLIRESLPSYYTEQPADPSSYDDDAYIDVKVESIPDGKHFIFITDTHWDWGNNAKRSPKLISYIKNRAYIDTVIFGGDFINLQTTKYLAKQVLTDFAFHFLGVLGKDLLPVMGNHDTNMANSPDTDFDTKYMPHNVVYDVLFREHRQGGNYWEDNEATLTAMATAASFSADRLADLKAQAMMNYWWDDANNKIRYIVHDTEKPHQTPMWELFENSTVPYMLWIYNVLCTTPEGYDVCFACHMIGIPNQAGLEANVPLRQISSLLMGLKTRTAKGFYASRPNANCEVMWPWTSHTLDFTQCNEVGKVFIIAGHAHEDGISIINQSASTYNNVSATLYDGQTLVDQTVVEANNGCAIPVIWTTRDAWQREGTPTMTNNSVNEQAFDVFTLREGEIRMTRIGAGSDRVIYIKA